MSPARGAVDFVNVIVEGNVSSGVVEDETVCEDGVVAVEIDGVVKSVEIVSTVVGATVDADVVSAGTNDAVARVCVGIVGIVEEFCVWKANSGTCEKNFVGLDACCDN